MSRLSAVRIKFAFGRGSRIPLRTHCSKLSENSFPAINSRSIFFPLVSVACTCFRCIFFFFLPILFTRRSHYTTYSINYTYIVLATYTADTYTNYAYTTLRYMYYNTIVINLVYGWRVYKVLFN